MRILDSGFPVFVPIKPPSKAVGSGASDAEKEARKHEVAVEQLSRAIIMMENSPDTKETAIAEANHDSLVKTRFEEVPAIQHI